MSLQKKSKGGWDGGGRSAPVRGAHFPINALCLCLLTTSLLTNSGCALTKKKMNPNSTYPKQPYQDGITHSDEVLDELGPPLKMTALPAGYAFMYEALTTREFQLGFGLPIPVIKWFKFVVARADYDHKVMIYQFDDEHCLIASGGNEARFDLGNSTAIQPIVTYQPMFDTSDVESDVVSFVEWPAFCLLPLPLTLNRAQSIDAGSAGLEQRGTAPGVGQRSMELHN